MKIGIIVPTRGMVYSQTIEAIERERKNYETTLYISHNLPIPEGHNELCNKALGDGNDYILLIEEDVVIPARAIEKMLASNADIACIDYGVSGWSCVTRDQRAEILWCGLGCTLIKREVFEALEKPYLRTDMVLDLPDFKWRQLPEQYVKTRNYGSLDIWFFTKAREKGFKIVQVEDEEAIHLQLDELGKKGINNGCHTISERAKIINKQTISRGGD
jgi:hypothetical protein